MTAETFAFIILSLGIVIIVTIGYLIAQAIIAIAEYEGNKRR